ncbi:MAG: RHS repeat-associated core domain-containing protein, partial [Armatimonadetes bacterium]|nr:RHS repeat-associated core domain-containing protein [Armatimonadota bacterium]
RTYGYDANGNRTSFTDSSGTITGTHDDQDRLLQYGALVFTYNDRGQLVSKTDTATSQTTTYSYDVLGNLLSVGLPDGRLIEYLVDPIGRRVGKKVDGMLEKQWLYRGHRIVAELDGTGAVISRFVWADGTGVEDDAVAALLDRLGVPPYSTTPQAGPAVPAHLLSGGNVYRIVSDHLGSPRLLVDVATGAVVSRVDYDEFGVVLSDSAPGFQPFGFAGGLCDADTGLVRFGARDYDAGVGRWTAKDPIVFGGGDTNMYRYVGNAPLDLNDPTGNLMTWICAKCRNLVYDKVYADCVKNECVCSHHGKSCHDACDEKASDVAVKSCKFLCF